MFSLIETRIKNLGVRYRVERMQTREKTTCVILTFNKDIGLENVASLLENIPYRDMRYNKTDFRMAYVEQ